MLGYRSPLSLYTHMYNILCVWKLHFENSANYKIYQQMLESYDLKQLFAHESLQLLVVTLFSLICFFLHSNTFLILL